MTTIWAPFGVPLGCCEALLGAFGELKTITLFKVIVLSLENEYLSARSRSSCVGSRVDELESCVGLCVDGWRGMVSLH